MGTILDRLIEVLPPGEEMPPAMATVRNAYLSFIEENREKPPPDIYWVGWSETAIAFPIRGANPTPTEVARASTRIEAGVQSVDRTLREIFELKSRVGVLRAGESEAFAEKLGVALADMLSLKPGMVPWAAENLFLYLLTRNAPVTFDPNDALHCMLPFLLAYIVEHQATLFYAQWRADGQPRIRLEGKLAAALMFTNYESSPLDPLQPPWATFLIEVPEQLLDPVTRILFQYRKSEAAWRIWLTGPDTYTQLTGSSFAALARMKRKDGHCVKSKARWQLLCAALRLLLGVLSMLNEGSHQVSRPPKLKKKKGRLRWVKPSNESIGGEYLLGKDIIVNIDCREHVRAYAEGRRSALGTLQWPVRGHYCDQPYGPGRALRKEIWRQPRFSNRGGAEGPMLMRTHVLQSKKRSTG